MEKNEQNRSCYIKDKQILTQLKSKNIFHFQRC